jgi:hypothetical protein
LSHNLIYECARGVENIMKRIIRSTITILTLSALMGACDGSSSGGGFTPPPPPPPPPPPAAQDPSGIWIGQAVTPDVADLVTGFETDELGDFTVGTAPFTATFTGGVAETRGIPGFYREGINSWHILGAATIALETPASTLSFWTRTVTDGDAATIVVRDTADAMIGMMIVPPDALITEFTVDSAGGLPIGSVDITVTTGEIVIDLVTFGFPSTASTDEIACLIDPNNVFVCIVADAEGALVAGANGTVAVAVDQVSGTGWLYAAPGGSFADGSTIAALTISAGTVVENTSLDLTIDGTGVSIDVTTTFDPDGIFDRGSDLATAAASWLNFDILGDASTFDVDEAGAISGISDNACMLMGDVTVMDATVNVYDVAITVIDGGECADPAGDYVGLGAIQDDVDVDDNFVFAVFVDGVSMIVGDVDRPMP